MIANPRFSSDAPELATCPQCGAVLGTPTPICLECGADLSEVAPMFASPPKGPIAKAAALLMLALLLAAIGMMAYAALFADHG